MESLNIVDYAIIGIIGISVFVAIFRGLITEVFSLFVWVGAFVGAIFYYEEVAKFLPSIFGSISSLSIDPISDDGANSAIITAGIGFAVTFLALLFILGLINLFISFLIRHLKISIYDRFLGVFFGAIRGAFIVSILTLFVINSPLKERPEWQKAKYAPMAERWSKVLTSFIPQSFVDQFNINQLIESLKKEQQTTKNNLNSTTPASPLVDPLMDSLDMPRINSSENMPEEIYKNSDSIDGDSIDGDSIEDNSADGASVPYALNENLTNNENPSDNSEILYVIAYD